MTDRPATSERSYLARTYDDDRFAWTRRKRVRRRLVVAEAVLISALVVLTIAAAVVGADRGWLAWPWSIALLGFVPIHSFLNLGIRGLYDRSERTLDEHQRRLRDESYIAVRWPATFVTLAAVLAVFAASLMGDTARGLMAGFLLWFGASLLPYWHLAWMLPDED